MYIEDDELRQLYKTSSSEHLQKLEADLMILEKNPQDQDAMEEFLREAHTLKGDSRMLGLDDIEMLVHHLEDSVEGIKAGESAITPELCDRLYQAIDAINQLSHQAITGEMVEVKPLEVLAALMGSPASGEAGDSEAALFDDDISFLDKQVNSEAALFDDDISFLDKQVNSEAALFDDDISFLDKQVNSEADLFDDDTSLIGEEVSAEADLFGDDTSLIGEEVNSEAELFENDTSLIGEEVSAEAALSKTQSESVVTPKQQQPVKPGIVNLDTIRVEPQKLDTLMTQASELAVTKLRISQQMSEIEQILSLWTGWQKQDQNLINELEQNLSPELFPPLKHFFNYTEQKVADLGSLINQLKTRASEDVASLGIISDRLESGIQGLRQLPLWTVFNIYPRMVRDLARQQGKDIELIIEGGDTKADKRIIEEIKDPLLHLIRNAIDHGIETPEERLSQGKPATATLTLRGYQTGNSIGISVSDDGRGLDLERIGQTAIKRQVCTEAELAAMSESEMQSLIFASGFSTRTKITELSGRGVGLDVVRANVERLKGSIQVASTPGNGCQFQVRLNTSLATTKVLIIEVNQTWYALPLEYIQTMITLTPQDIYQIEGKQTITFNDQHLSIAPLSSLLQLPATNGSSGNYLSCIVLQVSSNQGENGRDTSETSAEYFGVLVDDLVDQQDIVQKPQSKLLKRIPNIAGATILGSGEVCMILNPQDLLHSLRSGTWRHKSQPVSPTQSQKRNRLLLVEDSIIIRTQMQRLLKGAGYNVTIAENGLAGLQLVQTKEFDVVLSDVEMPQMSGLEMTTSIRQDSKYDQLPIVLITTLASAEDKRRGAEAGANAYLTKGDFEQQLLFQTLEQLINTKSI